jgi:hypothetical protein
MGATPTPTDPPAEPVTPRRAFVTVRSAGLGLMMVCLIVGDSLHNGMWGLIAWTTGGAR